MNNDYLRPVPNDEDEMIRTTYEQMEVPVNRNRLKDTFLKNADRKFTQNRWTVRAMFRRVLSPQAAFACSFTYALLVLLHIAFTSANTPLVKVSNENKQWNELEKWAFAYRSQLGFDLLYPKNSLLSFKDGTTIQCLSLSILSVDYSGNQRHFHLLDGTIEVIAAYNPDAPMVIAVQDSEITVTGTKFIVSTHND